MKVILLEDIKSLGKKNDIKEVSDGYARNFLFPRKKATPATLMAIKNAELKKEKETVLEKEKSEKLKTLAEKIKNHEITISAEEKKGKLFGSITVKLIAAELKKADLEVYPDCIIMKEAIKKTGHYEIPVKLSEQIETKINLEIKGI
jgi:large subunit ribosomal protein L9